MSTLTMAAPKLPSAKRRRLSLSPPPNSSSSDTTTPKTITPSNFHKLNIPNPTCISCHRSLNTTQGYLILCSRCSTPTCVVCSRTCNASVPSNSPTPHSVWPSSTTQTSPNPPPLPSTRRVALALTSTNTNLGTIPPTINTTNNITTGVGVVGPNSGSLLIGKRRKFTDDDVGGGVIDAGSLKPQENNLIAHANININGNVHHGDIEDHHQVPLSPGCGRVVCRNCCFENSQNNTITCYDCRGR